MCACQEQIDGAIQDLRSEMQDKIEDLERTIQEVREQMPDAPWGI